MKIHFEKPGFLSENIFMTGGEKPGFFMSVYFLRYLNILLVCCSIRPM
ncbi:Uncharacterized protein dnm_084930 [Desulfonema magnum]|uniref:Uncharacterized protein n=1 Tax=Desulfonema magnum TaxID=45655 RepID=A0A975GTR7_9BACT|nr:Uncharacterized protein dnm_084930 [Desulfonema magnum]